MIRVRNRVLSSHGIYNKFVFRIKIIKGLKLSKRKLKGQKLNELDIQGTRCISNHKPRA